MSGDGPEADTGRRGATGPRRGRERRERPRRAAATRSPLPMLVDGDPSLQPVVTADHWLETRKPRRRRRRLVARGLLGALAVFLVVVGGLWGRAMLRPSSVGLGVRSVEWVRANGGAWFVNDVERLWYSWHAPKKGGPALKALPAVPLPVVSVASPRAVANVRVKPAYRPPRIVPVIRPALAGEGYWHPARLAVKGGSPVMFALYRPQPEYPRLVAYVAWVDHLRTRLALYPGRYEPPSSLPRGPMEVPLGQRARLLATFNSGFTYKDGHGGFVVDGRVYQPLRDGLATLVAYRSGRVDVTTWRGGPAGSRQVVLARQNLPLIVDHGRPNPNLSDGPEWGATLGNAIQVWRSAVGVDRHGNLLYAAADYQTTRSLAALMIHIGAVRAMQLDINAEWPSFIVYGKPGAQRPLKLVPNYQQRDTRYLTPDDRDFFAVYTRAGGGPAVPLR